MFTIEGSRIQLRPITESDADFMVKWRNSNDAREAFFSRDIVTPDTHIAFVRNRKPNDLIWMVEYKQPDSNVPIGTVSLTVDVIGHKAEFGRLFIDPYCRGLRFAEDAVHLTLFYGFEVLRVDYIWADVKSINKPALALYKKTGFILQPINSVHLDSVILVYLIEHWKDIGYWKFTKRK